MSRRHKMPKQPARKSLPILDIEYEEYTDGTVGAHIVDVPGTINATDEGALFYGLNWLVSQIGKIEADAQKRGGGTRMADVGMQGKWIDGEYCVRFLPSPNWGIAFPAEADLQTWLAHIIKIVVTPNNQGGNHGRND